MKTINGRRWYGGADACRRVCNALGLEGMAVMNWVDMSEEGMDPREDGRFNMQLVFTMLRAQRDGRFGTVLQMCALPMDGRCMRLSDHAWLEDGKAITEEDVAALLHNVVDDDSEPQYTFPSFLEDGKGDKFGGWYVSEGGWDTNVLFYPGDGEDGEDGEDGDREGK